MIQFAKFSYDPLGDILKYNRWCVKNINIDASPATWELRLDGNKILINIADKELAVLFRLNFDL